MCLPTTFDIAIENVGDTDLSNGITDLKGSSVQNSGGRVSGDAIGWMIPRLPPAPASASARDRGHPQRHGHQYR